MSKPSLALHTFSVVGLVASLFVTHSRFLENR